MLKKEKIYKMFCVLRNYYFYQLLAISIKNNALEH